MEPPYAERHVRWCERSHGELIPMLLLDCIHEKCTVPLAERYYATKLHGIPDNFAIEIIKKPYNENKSTYLRVRSRHLPHGKQSENQPPSMVFFRGFNQRYRMSKLGHSLFPPFMGTVVLVLRGMVIRSDPHHERGVGNHSPQGLLQ